MNIAYFNILYTEIAEALRREFDDPDFNASSISSPSVAKLPAAQIVEMSNTTYQRSLDSEAKEHHSNVMIQCEYYDNSTSRLSVCRHMAKVVDDIFVSHNFTRTMLMSVDNADERITRITTRYTAVVGADNMIYRR